MAFIDVNSAQALPGAVRAAQAGDVLRLASGNYGTLRLADLVFANPITIVSATARSAVFDGLNLTNVTNVTFKNVTVGRALGQDEPTWVRFVNVLTSRSIAFDGIHVRGSLDDNPQNDGQGMFVQNSSYVTVANSEFEQLSVGAAFGTSDNVAVTNSAFHDLRIDGVNFNGNNNVLISDNTFRDFFPIRGNQTTEDHPDAIQFFTLGANRASSNIRITNNVIMQGSGESMQGIFLTDQLNNLPYQNVLIENNLVYMRGYNAIMVGGGLDVVITNNTTISPTDDTLQARIRIDKVQNATITDNVVDEFAFQSVPTLAYNNFELRHNLSARAQIPNLNADEAATAVDLLFPSSGYSVPVSLSTGATSTALGSSLSNLLGDRAGSEFQPAAPLDLEWPSTFNSYGFEPEALAPVAVQSLTMFDSFVAFA